MYRLILGLLIGPWSALAYTIEEPTRSLNLHVCPLARMAIREWKKRPENQKVADYLKELSTYEGPQVKVQIEPPVRILLKNIYLSSNPPLPLARVTATRGKFTEAGVMEYRGPGTQTLLIQFNLLGICPFVSGTSPSHDEIRRAVESLLEVKAGQ